MAVAGAVRCCCTRARHRDMRQRSQVVQRKAFPMQPPGKLSITDSRLHGHRMALSIQGDHFVEMFEGKQVAGGVGNIIKGVARTKSFDLVAALDQFLDLLNGFRRVDLRGVVGVITCPIF